MFETHKFGNKTRSGEIDLNIRTLASPKVGQNIKITQLSSGLKFPNPMMVSVYIIECGVLPVTYPLRASWHIRPSQSFSTSPGPLLLSALRSRISSLLRPSPFPPFVSMSFLVFPFSVSPLGPMPMQYCSRCSCPASWYVRSFSIYGILSAHLAVLMHPCKMEIENTVLHEDRSPRSPHSNNTHNSYC